MSDLLESALDYRRRGFCILPLGGDKKPAVRWKRYQTELPTESTVRRWFERPRPGLAVVFGQISGGLASRDFDDMETYSAWARDYPTLAETLPTVETRRGRHVYCKVVAECVQRFREAIGKPKGKGAVSCAGGELRIGVGCYSVLPPSIHPEGHVYRWLTPSEEFPLVDLFDSGFRPCNREVQREPKTLEAGSEGLGGEGETIEQVPLDSNESKQPPPLASCLEYSPDSLPSLLHERVELAIERTIPTSGGRRHRMVFEFCRELQAIPELKREPATAFRQIVREWHRRARPYIQTKGWEETWLDFVEGWGKVRNPKGEERIAMMFAKVVAMQPPAEAEQFDTAELKLLVGLCRELQRTAGKGPFYLSSRAAGGLLGRSHVQVSRWLRLLCIEEVLKLVSKGSNSSGEASRYRYLGEIPLT
jgi:hypothetical protein